MENNNANVETIKNVFGYIRYNYMHFLFTIILISITIFMAFTDVNETIGLMIINYFYGVDTELPAAPQTKWSYAFALGAFAFLLLCTMIGTVSQAVFRLHYLHKALNVEEPNEDEEDDYIDPKILAAFASSLEN